MEFKESDLLLYKRISKNVKKSLIKTESQTSICRRLCEVGFPRF